MNKRGTSLDQAIANALRRATWRDGATLIQYDDGSFDAIPPIYLTEVMWIGYQHVKKDFGNIRDWVFDAGLYFPLTEGEIRMLKDQICKECTEEPAEVDTLPKEIFAPVIRPTLRR
ncbi:MAG: hypothetical protein ACLFV5_00760 [Anaerolineales bacterium]